MCSVGRESLLSQINYHLLCKSRVYLCVTRLRLRNYWGKKPANTTRIASHEPLKPLYLSSLYNMCNQKPCSHSLFSGIWRESGRVLGLLGELCAQAKSLTCTDNKQKRAMSKRASLFFVCSLLSGRFDAIDFRQQELISQSLNLGAPDDRLRPEGIQGEKMSGVLIRIHLPSQCFQCCHIKGPFRDIN